jgi:hypothetical protein
VSAVAAALLVALAVLAVLAFGPDLAAMVRRRRAAARATAAWRSHDPGRERRAELRARELLRSVVGEELYSMYRELGFIRVRGGDRRAGGYGYLIYPHRPIVAYAVRSGELLNEYCVVFPDQDQSRAGARLPDADDVLAKWMALRGDERRLIGDANMHVPGRQLDPAQVRRDLVRLREWEGRRRRSLGSTHGDGVRSGNEQRATSNELPA